MKFYGQVLSPKWVEKSIDKAINAYADTTLGASYRKDDSLYVTEMEWQPGGYITAVKAVAHNESTAITFSLVVDHGSKVSTITEVAAEAVPPGLFSAPLTSGHVAASFTTSGHIASTSTLARLPDVDDIDIGCVLKINIPQGVASAKFECNGSGGWQDEDTLEVGVNEIRKESTPENPIITINAHQEGQSVILFNIGAGVHELDIVNRFSEDLSSSSYHLYIDGVEWGKKEEPKIEEEPWMTVDELFPGQENK